MVVRPSVAALIAGALAFVCVAVLFCVRTVPDRVVTLMGGPEGGVDRWGGLRVEYIPPPGAEAEIAEYLEAAAGAERDGNVLRLEFPGVAQDTVATLIDVLVAGGLAMKEELEEDWALAISLQNPLVVDRSDDRDGTRDDSDPRVSLRHDYWQAEYDGNVHRVFYLEGPSREAIEAAIDNARARGWSLPPGREIAFEEIEAHLPDQPSRYRTYVLSTEVLIDGTMIDHATGSFEPTTNRAIVLLDFTAEAGDRFCDITRRIAGKKLAVMLGGRVRSAPVINSAICGGRASITMGGSDPDRQLRERDMLVEVLDHGALPPGGTIRSKQWSPPADTSVAELLGRLVLGLLAGLALALVTFAIVRFAKPSVGSRTHDFKGAFPWKRVAITAIGPIALIVGSRLTLPGLNEAELELMTQGAHMEEMSVIALGLAPIMLAYFLVEVVALIVPQLRWRRHDPQGRIALGRATAILALVLALGHGWLIARYFEGSRMFDGYDTIIATPGLRFQSMVMLSVAAGSLMLAVIAGLISEHGLGNGYGVLLATGIVFDLLPNTRFVNPLGAEMALGVVTFGALVTASVFMLRWRIREGNQPALRLPTSGVSPLADTAAFIAMVFMLTGMASNDTMFDVLIWSYTLAGWKVRLALIAIGVPLWAWLFARPSVIARVAMQGGLEHPTTATWTRAMAASALLLLGAGVFTMIAPLDGSLVALINPVSALLVGAVALDVIADARARRANLTLAGIVHQPQYLGAIEHALAEASIPYHCHASHLRTLFAFFAPWAPIHILVTEDHAIEARLVIDNVLRASRVAVPEARVTG